MSTPSQETFSYTAPWIVYGLSWSVRPDRPHRLALGSFLEGLNNRVSIVERPTTPGATELFETHSIVHPYPATKIMWVPDRTGSREDLFATASDALRLYRVGDHSDAEAAAAAAEAGECDSAYDGIALRHTFGNVKSGTPAAPLTSLDWSDADPSLVGTSSVDTTCTIWDVTTGQAKTQLIAHDKEVYDLAFAPSADVFASTGADGSVRMFDLRALDHSTILYEAPSCAPLLRLSWNKIDHNYVAAVLADEPRVVVIDLRSASVPVAELVGHTGSINALTWAPHSSCHLATAGDDSQALIWDLTQLPLSGDDAYLTFGSEGSANALAWGPAHPDWVAIAYDNTVQTLRV